MEKEVGIIIPFNSISINILYRIYLLYNKFINKILYYECYKESVTKQFTDYWNWLEFYH